MIDDMKIVETPDNKLSLVDAEHGGWWIGYQSTGDIGIDYGCMWGVLSVGLAKRGASVIAVDQTEDSLIFLSKRSECEKIDNIFCVQDDIREVQLRELADFAIVNGVLEWVPEFLR